jgi:hypothetical protein
VGGLYRWLDGPLRSQIVRAWGGWVRPAPLQDDPSWYETGLSEDELIGILPARSIGEESGEDLPPDAIDFLDALRGDRNGPEPKQPESTLPPAEVLLLPEPGVCSTRPDLGSARHRADAPPGRLPERPTAAGPVSRSLDTRPPEAPMTRPATRSEMAEAAATGSTTPAEDERALAAQAHEPRGRWDDLAWPLAWLARQLAEILEPRWVVLAHLPCRLGPYCAVQLSAPLAVVEPTHWATARTGVLTGAPRLVIEVAEAENRGVVLRRRVDQWLGHGAGEVWVVDPARGWLTSERPGREPSWYAPPAHLPLGALAPGRSVGPRTARPPGRRRAGRR